MVSSASPSSQQSYKISNWREYNASLVRRGAITVWFDEDGDGAYGP